MADTQNMSASPLPNGNGPPAPATGGVSKRKKRQRQQQNQSMPQADGAVSDSVANPNFHSQAKTAPKQRQQSAAQASDQPNMGKVSTQKTRPVSLGANMHPNTPFKEQAYAGPTFQASPAPSSLPVPKFASKSVPNVAAPKSLEGRVAGEQTPEKEQSSPEQATSPPNREVQQSPLDLFFKADKAERDKSRSSSMQSPEMMARRPPATKPRNPFAQQSSKSSFLRELDRDDSLPSPRTIPQNNRPATAHKMSSPPGARPESNSDREAATQSLKDILFNTANGTPPPNNNATPRAQSSSRTSESPFNSPSPFQRPSSGPSTPTPPADQQSHYSLHYGNRNLSPLFKAARQDTPPPPPRPSGLRQQELASDTASRQAPPVDADSFSRSYLDQHIRASQSATLPPLPQSIPNGNGPRPHSSSHQPPSQYGPGAGATASPRTGSASSESGDVKTMEDDLRRMLKINVLSN